MKIVILNNVYLTDRHRARLQAVGEIVEYQKTSTEDQVISRTSGADVVIVNTFIAPITNRVLSNMSGLKLIAINSTGFDNLDVSFARQMNISVSNTSGFSTEAVAEHTLSLILAIARNIVVSDRQVRAHPYEIDATNKDHHKLIGFNLEGKTLGIVGFGKIGKRVSEIGLSLGMNILYYDKKPDKNFHYCYADMPQILCESDVLTLHLPLNLDTHNFITCKELGQMKSTALLINTARSGLLNIDDLYLALKNNVIYGAGLDVPDNIPVGHPILSLDNLLITPHMGWYTKESLEKSPEIIVSNIENFVKGNATNIIN